MNLISYIQEKLNCDRKTAFGLNDAINHAKRNGIEVKADDVIAAYKDLTDEKAEKSN